jgi:hypothetical protein
MLTNVEEEEDVKTPAEAFRMAFPHASDASPPDTL